MMKQVLLFFCFASALSLSVSESKSNSLQNPAIDSFSFGYIQVRSVIFQATLFSFSFFMITFCVQQTKTPQNCSYLVTISTRCSSPKFTWENIGIAFGDAHGNEVYKGRLDGPGRFEQCSLDVFEINGACLSDICFLWLYRSGAVDDWKPESVKISCSNACFPIFNIHFNINFSLPDAAWFGYKWCNTDPPYLANGFPFPTGVFF
ncbi:hypothetical protein VIGAN_11197200 [Vigna angularis var. angularis]|uniref:Uncharacterized protein n=1 Tax=Vigna angularis var. angularis TaxID=157739 RepID=A0A0S3TB71_PHAAN|nr:hypothetical protein VIGAN_11197200 [Vigna angularis var. angularis]